MPVFNRAGAIISLPEGMHYVVYMSKDVAEHKFFPNLPLHKKYTVSCTKGVLRCEIVSVGDEQPQEGI